MEEKFYRKLIENSIIIDSIISSRYDYNAEKDILLSLLNSKNKELVLFVCNKKGKNYLSSPQYIAYCEHLFESRFFRNVDFYFMNQGTFYALVADDFNSWNELCDDVEHKIIDDNYILETYSYESSLGDLICRITPIDHLCTIRSESKNAYLPHGIITTLPTSKEYSDIVSFLIRGDYKGVSLFLDEMAKRVRYSQEGKANADKPSSIKRSYIDYTLALMHYCSDVGIDVDAILDDDPYITIMSKSTTPEIKYWFLSLFFNLHNEMTLVNMKNGSALLYNILLYIECSYSDLEFSLAKIASHLQLTESYISDFFHKEYKATLNAYINSRRINFAKYLLVNTTLKIKEISIETGYNSQKSFNENFKKITKISPGEYRKASKI